MSLFAFVDIDPQRLTITNHIWALPESWYVTIATAAVLIADNSTITTSRARGPDHRRQVARHPPVPVAVSTGSPYGAGHRRRTRRKTTVDARTTNFRRW